MPFESGARKLVLASSSPRRRKLLREAGYEFAVDPPQLLEELVAGEPPAEQARRLALAKGREVAARSGAGSCVLAADTLVVLDGEIFGKPRDAEQAELMLLRLAARRHLVVSGYAVIECEGGETVCGVSRSRVRMRPISPEEARRYAHSGEPLDKAGAYAVQGAAGRFITRIEGLQSNVIGLPIEELAPVLARFGVVPQ